MNSFFTPTIGMRFSMRGANFEITFFQGTYIRFAAVAGGKQHQTNVDHFNSLIASGTIKCELAPNAIQVHADTAASVVRKHRYVYAALVNLTKPTAFDALAKMIELVAEEIGDLTPPGVSTVQRWIKDEQKNKEVSLSKPLLGNRYIRFSPEVERIFQQGLYELILTDTPKNCVDLEAFIAGRVAEEGLPGSYKTPSLRALQMRVKNIDPYILTRAQKGKEAADRLCRAAGQHIISCGFMALVEVDTHQIDLLLIDPQTGRDLGRPFLSLAIDVFSRAIVGVYLSFYPASSITGVAVLKDMVTRQQEGLPGGVPAKLVPDNGVEFKNSTFARFCQKLAVTITPSPIRDPDSKAHVESFFKTLTFGLIQKIRGTTFSNPNARGDYDSQRHAVTSIEQLKGYINQWINECYHTAIHSTTRRAPIKAYEDAVKIMPALTLSYAEADVIARCPENRTINHGRVEVRSLFFYSHALATLEAQGLTKVVVLVDELNLHEVIVEHPTEKGVFIRANSCDPEYTLNLTIYAHEESQKIKKELTQSDLSSLGTRANSYARYRLLKQIQEDSKFNKRKLRRLTNGLGLDDFLESNNQNQAIEKKEDLSPVVTDADKYDEKILSEKPRKPQKEQTKPLSFDTLELD